MVSVVEPMSLVLLGCRVDGPAALSPPARRRALRAASALQAGLTHGILACGGKTWNGVREADALCAFLAERGIAESALERESSSHSTRQNAHYAAALLHARGVRRIWLVTCDWHMPRALRCFEGAGFQAEPLPALSPPIAVRAGLFRAARERVCLALDALATRGFSRV
ncbi:MAG TPA: YdcF family protein [Polyangiaceae bacterium]|nr:YdcF family protein [Polyangiaceae bacterium]